MAAGCVAAAGVGEKLGMPYRCHASFTDRFRAAASAKDMSPTMGVDLNRVQKTHTEAAEATDTTDAADLG